MVITHNREISPSRPVFLDDYYYGEKLLEDAFISIEYQKTFMWDTLSRKTCTTTDILLVGSNWVKYQDLVKFKYDTYAKVDYDRAEKGLGKAITSDVYWASFYDVYLMDLSRKEIQFSCRLAAEDYQVKEPAPRLNWSLSDSTRVIGPYQCQHATSTYGGRRWHAWFTLDVPIPLGPWKLGGLPGLIVLAYDEARQYEFEALSVSDEARPINLINYPYRTITRKQYNKMFQELMEDYYTFTNSHLSGSGFQYIGEKGSKYPKESMTFSLIEKDEK